MDLLSDLGDAEDEGSLLAKLREINDVLTMGQGDVRVQPLVPALVRVIEASAYDGQVELLAARALNNILDIEPRSSRVLVSEGGLSVLCAKLLDFRHFEVAEQCLNCMTFLTKQQNHRDATAHHLAILRAGGLHAATAYFDFFPKHMQLKALSMVEQVSRFVCSGSSEAAIKEDCGYVLQVLPALHQCLESADQEVVGLACAGLGTLVHQYDRRGQERESGKTRPSEDKPSLRPAEGGSSTNTETARRTAQRQLNRSSRTHSRGRSDTSKSSGVVESDDCELWERVIVCQAIQPKVAAKLMSLVVNRDVTASKLDPGIVTQIVQTLTCAIRADPQLLTALFEAGLMRVLVDRLDQSSLFSLTETASDQGDISRVPRLDVLNQDLSDTLELLGAMIPALPGSESFDAWLEGSGMTDDTEVNQRCSSKKPRRGVAEMDHPTTAKSHENSRKGSTSSTPPEGECKVAQGLGENERVEDSATQEEEPVIPDDPTIWACPTCTFHNPVGQASCEICGQVSPKVQERAASAQSTERPSVRALLDKDRDKLTRTVQQVHSERPELLAQAFSELLERLLTVALESAMPSIQDRSISLVTALTFHVAIDTLEHELGADSKVANSGKFHVVAALLRSGEASLVIAALSLLLVLLKRVPSVATEIVAREGLFDPLSRLAESDQAASKAALACIRGVHQVHGTEMHSLTSACSLCRRLTAPTAKTVSLRQVCLEVRRIATWAREERQARAGGVVVQGESPTDEQDAYEEYLQDQIGPGGADPCVSDEDIDGDDIDSRGATGASSSSSHTADTSARSSSRRSKRRIQRKRRSISQPVDSKMTSSSSTVPSFRGRMNAAKRADLTIHAGSGAAAAPHRNDESSGAPSSPPATKKRRMFSPVHQHINAVGILFEHNVERGDGGSTSSDGAGAREGECDSRPGALQAEDSPPRENKNLQRHWNHALVQLRDLVNGPGGVSVDEMDKSALFEHLLVVLDDPVGRQEFDAVFASDHSRALAKLSVDLLTSLHGAEQLRVRKLGSLRDLTRPAHFVIKADPDLQSRAVQLLRELVGGVIRTGTVRGLKDGTKLLDGLVPALCTLDQDFLLEPLVTVRDLNKLLGRQFGVQLAFAIQAMEKVLLTPKSQHSRLCIGDLVRPSSAWSWSNQHGGASVGVVVDVGKLKKGDEDATGAAAAVVTWLEGSLGTNVYRFSLQGPSDLEHVHQQDVSAGFVNLAMSWRAALQEGVRVDLLGSDLRWGQGVVMKTVFVSELETNMLCVQVAEGRKEWVLQTSGRLLPHRTKSSHSRCSAAEAVDLFDQDQIVLAKQARKTWQTLKVGDMVDLCDKEGIWIPAVLIAGPVRPETPDPRNDATGRATRSRGRTTSSSSSKKDASGGNGAKFLFHDLAHDDTMCDTWVSEDSNCEIAPLLSRVGGSLPSNTNDSSASASRSSSSAKDSGVAAIAKQSIAKVAMKNLIYILQRYAKLNCKTRDSCGANGAKTGDAVHVKLTIPGKGDFALPGVVCSTDANLDHLFLVSFGTNNTRMGISEAELYFKPPAASKVLTASKLERFVKQDPAIIGRIAEALDPTSGTAATEAIEQVEQLVVNELGWKPKASLRSSRRRQSLRRNSSSSVGAGAATEEVGVLLSESLPFHNAFDSEDDASVARQEAGSLAERLLARLPDASSSGAGDRVASSRSSLFQRLAQVRERVENRTARNASRADLQRILQAHRRSASTRRERRSARFASSASTSTPEADTSSSRSSSRQSRPREVRLHAQRVLGARHDALLIGDHLILQRRDNELANAPSHEATSRKASSCPEPATESTGRGDADANIAISSETAMEAFCLRPSPSSSSSAALPKDMMLCEGLERLLWKPDLAPQSSSSSSSSSAAAVPALQSDRSSGWEASWNLEYGIESEAKWQELRAQALRLGDVMSLSGSFKQSEEGELSVQTHFPSLTWGGVWITDGSWYYEVEIKRPGLAQLGWASTYFEPKDESGMGCGDDQHSWAYDGNRRKKWNVDSESWGARWQPGDVIGCAITVDGLARRATMAFSRNGSWAPPMGTAFKDVPFAGLALRPVITFNRSFTGMLRAFPQGFDPHPAVSRFPLVHDPSGFSATCKPIAANAAIAGAAHKPQDQLTKVETSDCTRQSGRDEAAEIRFREASAALPVDTKLETIMRTICCIAASKAMAGQHLWSGRLVQKILFQLKDAVAVCADALPAWLWHVVLERKELVPLEVRMALFELTSFGVARAVHRLKELEALETQSLNRQRGGEHQGQQHPEDGAENRLRHHNDQDDDDDGDESDEEGDAERDAPMGAVDVVVDTAESAASPGAQDGDSRMEHDNDANGSSGDTGEASGSAEEENITIEPRSTRNGFRLVANLAGTSRGQLGGLRKQKTVVPRARVLEAAMYLIKADLTGRVVLSVEFDGETGHGLGPTLEFYSLVSMALQRKSLQLWQETGPTAATSNQGSDAKVPETDEDVEMEDEHNSFVFSPHGLWPRPLPSHAPGEGNLQQAAQDPDVQGTAVVTPTTDSDDLEETMRRRSLRQHSGGRRGTQEVALPTEVMLDQESILGGTHSRERALKLFRFIGRFIGKALEDRRLLDLPLSIPLCKLILNKSLDLDDLVHIDQDMGKSFLYLRSLAASYERVRMATCGAAAEKAEEIKQFVEGMYLDFTVPGFPDLELVPGGAEQAVQAENLTEYLRLVQDRLLHQEVREQVAEIRAGIDEFLPVQALELFSPGELEALLAGGNNNERWDADHIARNIVCKHGYEPSSPQIKYLVTVLASLEKADRRLFMQFLTGSPRLPIGGFGELRPRLTVVRKNCSSPDQHLPSCSTCQVYLKWPAYSSLQIAEKMLKKACREGQGAFALS